MTAVLSEPSTFDRFRVGQITTPVITPQTLTIDPPSWPLDAPMRVLSFDQSLSNTGWCLLVEREGRPWVETTGMIKTEGDKSMPSKLARGLEMHNSMVEVIDLMQPDFITYETPVGGPAMMSADSSLLAAQALVIAAAAFEVPTQTVASGRLKRHLTGSGKATKKEVKEAVLARMPDLVERKVKPLNEHIFDAIGVGLTFLES